MSSLWTRYFKAAPHSLQRRHKTQIALTKEKTKTTPRVIFNLKQGSLRAKTCKFLAETTARIWWQDFKRKSPTASLERLQASRRKPALQVNSSFSLKTPKRRSEQTNFCWLFSSGQTTALLRFFKKRFTEFLSCQTHQPEQCPPLAETPRKLSCLKTFSVQVSKFIISWRKTTKSINLEVRRVADIQKH